MDKVFIIAEIGQAHEGSLGIAHSYIDALADTGVDAIKWQTHIADAESSPQEPFRVQFSYEDATRIDYWRRMEFTREQWQALKQHCEEKGMEFISSPFSNAAIDLLEALGVQRYKVGSGEVSNWLLLEKMARTGKPIILSSGMSSFEELDATIQFLKGFNNPLAILQCTTAYPTVPQQWGLNLIQELKNRYQLPVGFSDHSGDVNACIAATALGAEILEFHVVFDKRMFGPDAKASLTIDQTKQLVQGVRQVSSALAHPVNKTNNVQFDELKHIFGKTLAVNRDCTAGTLITFDMLEAKKPRGQGIEAAQFRTILGKKLVVPKKAWEFIREEDIVCVRKEK